ncbi:MAG: hypothetical protein BWY43_00639 [candidate division WS2 bacterium ADurb.Bin280]|uniref:Uncharacterized protein n=1 Tax=candidate division WS2 bacterium ADurb.Bin280 TaxID=1852829 RepID=A0A1V5SDJ5_9BACT|nr:MAG: hypothetical protein BWY43_00639 [candidate division WS2 bacterium ADurb.Bin280]
MKKLKIILFIVTVIFGVSTLALYLLSLGASNGGLGSSYPQYVDLKSDELEKKMALGIYKESCAKTVSDDKFVAGLTVGQATECNQNPKAGGISFVGGNGNEMYLLSQNHWDKRVLLATYYLLQRGFNGDDKFSLKMDCSPSAFEIKPKMTLGIHYGYKDKKEISFIKSIENPQPNLDVQYVSSGKSSYSPEGTLSENTANSISPHAYGQALDVYSYGCASLYVRLEADESAQKWACGLTGGGGADLGALTPVASGIVGAISSASGNVVSEHNYIYPANNLPLEIAFSNNDFEKFDPNTKASEIPIPKESYLLDPQSTTSSCDGQDVTLQVQDTCRPSLGLKQITYKNKGCIALNQPQGYKSSYIYGAEKPAYPSDDQTPLIQPFQYPSAVFLPSADNCTCQVTSGTNDYQVDATASFYQKTLAQIDFVSPVLALSIPSELQKDLKGEDLKKYLREQAEKSKKIVIEASLLFSLAEENGDYKSANDFFAEFVDKKLPENQNIINQLAISADNGFLDSYSQLARLIYGANDTASNYDPSLTIGRVRGLGYNATEKDRVHIGF